jgi:hypothetical protein
MNGAGGADGVLVWAWRQQSVWSQGAGNLKATLFRTRKIVLWLTVSAAILATLGVQITVVSATWGRVFAAAAAVAVGLVTFAQRATSRKQVQDWVRARSVSEGLKGEVFRFLAGVVPYRAADRADVLKRNIDKMLGDAKDLARCTIGVTPEERPLPAVSDIDTYIAERVREQIAIYYRPQSEAMKRLADRYRAVVNVLAIVAMLLGLGAAFTGWQQFAGWAPVVTTVIAAVAAHAAVNRYDALALEYARTDQQLERLLLERPTGTGADRQAADDRFVAEAEAVISVQNESWMARSVAAVAGAEANAEPERPADQPSPGA